MSTFVRRGRSLLAALLMAAAVPFAASAQAQASNLDTAQAQAFLGSWIVSLDAQGQAFELDLNITDVSGKVAVSMGSELMGGMQAVTNVTRNGENLVLRYEIDAQGQMAPVAVTLAPNGAQLNTTMDFADGMFVISGTATKRPSE